MERSKQHPKKHFNTTGKCYPSEHYMVDIHNQLAQLQQMVSRGDYFCMNRARQYGKTTTLSLLKESLEDEYTIFSISFEGIGTAAYESDQALSYAFLCLLNDCLTYNEVKHVSEPLKELISDTAAHSAESFSLIKLSRLISQLCDVSDKPVILFIDEVDQAGNNKSFLEFLGLLRDKYLKRRERPTFWSVILASVYDIKNLKLKLRPQEDHQYNSPWNIAADFDIDMNFTRTDIDDMRKKLSDIPQLKKMLYELLYEGQTFLYNTDDNELDIAEMLGYIRNDNGKVIVANRIFETRLYNLFISEERMQSAIFTEGSKDRNLFIREGRLDMRWVLERFRNPIRK